jgi:hypothetical protein
MKICSVLMNLNDLEKKNVHKIPVESKNKVQ